MCGAPLGVCNAFYPSPLRHPKIAVSLSTPLSPETTQQNWGYVHHPTNEWFGDGGASHDSQSVTVL